MSNLFIFKNGQLLTPCIENSGVNGVVRRWLIENHLVKVVALTFDDLISAEAMFFCNSLNGIVPVNQLGEHQYSQTHESWQIILKLQQKLEALFCSNVLASLLVSCLFCCAGQLFHCGIYH